MTSKSKTSALYDLAIWKNGLAFRDIQCSPEGKPVIKIAELKNGITGQTKFTQDVFDDSVALHNGDMLFSWSGNPDTSIDVFYYDLPDGWLNQHIFKVTPIGVDKGFLYYLLKYHKPTFTAIAANKQTTGLGHVTVKDLKELIVDVPPIEIQRSIANVLSLFDDKITTNTKINHNLEQIAQTIFKSWFVDFEPWDGEQPSDWYTGILSEISPRVYSGGTPNTGIATYWSGNIPWLSSGETRHHLISSPEKFITQSGVDNSSTRLAHRFDVVMASAGQGSTRGQTSLLLLDSYVNQSMIVMSSPYPLYLFLNLFGRYKELRAMSDSSSIRGSITTKMLAQLPILVPSKKVLEEFEIIVSPLIGYIESNLNESTRLVTLRDTLLPRLMSGELSTTNLEC